MLRGADMASWDSSRWSANPLTPGKLLPPAMKQLFQQMVKEGKLRRVPAKSHSSPDVPASPQQAKASVDAIRAALTPGNAIAEPPKQTSSYLLYWRKPEEWGTLIHDWVRLAPLLSPLR
jgi:hypothetical protein